MVAKNTNGETKGEKDNTTALKPLEIHLKKYMNPSPTRNTKDVEEKISSERQSYAEGLTIHGANRIATGRLYSRIIWSFLVLASLTTAVFISKEHWDAYLSRQSTTHTKIIPQQSIPVPSITVCSYTGVNNERRRFNDGSPNYERPTLVDFPSMGDCG